MAALHTRMENISIQMNQNPLILVPPCIMVVGNSTVALNRSNLSMNHQEMYVVIFI
jgi:hypothetical protein